MLKHITITLNNLLKEENKMYRQSPCTPISEFFLVYFVNRKQLDL